MEQETPQDSLPAGKRVVKIDYDEWYPVYEIGERWGREVEMPEDKIQWVERVQCEFGEVQRYLADLHQAAK